MNNMQRSASRSTNVRVLYIQLSVLAGTMQLRRPDAATKDYWDRFRENERTRGIHDATITFKHYYDNAKSLCLRAKLPAQINRWMKRDKDGVPSYVNRIIKDLDLDLGKQMHCVFLLTFLSQYEIVSTDRIVTDLNSLTDHQTSVWTKRTVSDFVRFFKGEKFLRSKVVKSGKPSCVIDFVSIKGGPYGLCTPSWIKDLVVLQTKPKIANAIISLEEKLGSENPLSRLIDLINNIPVNKLENGRVFKTFAIPDKGPKVRTVTSGNYFVQRALKPLHNWLMDLLKGIPEDGSHTQDRAAKLVKRWTKLGYQPYCYDLTAATDRMPVNLQVLLFTLLKLEWTEEFECIMRYAEVFDNTTKQFYELSVGQPMGLFSSWPSFTLIHHYIIRFAFYLNGVSPKNGYAIIGDDVAILNGDVAKDYSLLIQGLGISISSSKSLTPETASKPSGELAKRLFLEGREISPIRPKVLVAIRREPQGPGLLKSFALEIIRRYPGDTIWRFLTSERSPGPPILKLLPRKKRNTGFLILSAPFGGGRVPIFEGAQGCAVPKDRKMILPNIVRVESPWDKFSNWEINNGVNNIYKDLILDKVVQDIVDIEETLRRLIAFQSIRSDNDLGFQTQVPMGSVYQILVTSLEINPFFNAVKHIQVELNDILADTMMFMSSPASEITDKLDKINVSISLICDWCSGEIRRDFQDAKSKKANLLMRKAKEVHGYCSRGEAKLAISWRVKPGPSEEERPLLLNRLLGSSEQVALLGLPPRESDEDY